jgi:hypothetical protein
MPNPIIEKMVRDLHVKVIAHIKEFGNPYDYSKFKWRKHGRRKQRS